MINEQRCIWQRGREECVELLQRYGAKYGTTGPSTLGREALIDLFEQHCKSRGGEMSLDWHDVSDLLDNVGQKPTDEAVRKLFDVADDDHDGLIGKDAMSVAKYRLFVN